MSRQNNLHPSLKAFVGRTAELRRVRELVDGHRMVSLVGAAGIGKTRLALEAMSERLAAPGAALSGGLWFCDLTEARDAQDVCRAVSRVMGAPAQSSDLDAAVGATGQALAERGEQLVVLDNCEQVADHMLATLGVWLLAAPLTRFLVTSRERLRLEGEVTLELGALPLPDADARDVADVAGSDSVALFLERATRVAADLVLDQDNAACINRIVHLLDGLPLAIELAAARAGVLAPADLLERLSQRFDVLSSHSRQVSDRHRTLRAAIDWSWDLLEEWERAGLAQLSAFRGGFTIDAADRVVRVQSFPRAPDVIGGLQWLRDRSLVWVDRDVRGDAPRRFGLYLSIRDYAAEKLRELELRDATYARHAAYYATLVQDLWRSPLDGVTAALLSDEEKNLLVAFTRAVSAEGAPVDYLHAGVVCLLALESVHASRGPWREYAERLTAAIDAPAFHELTPSLVARCYQARGRMRGLMGRIDDARHDFEQGVEAARRADDARVEGTIRLRLGVLENNGARFEAARALYEQALLQLRAAGDRHGEGQALGNLAVVDGQEGRYGDARGRFDEARAIYAEVGDRQLLGRTIGNLGALLQDEGKFDEAALHFEQAIDALRDAGHQRDAAVFVGAQGILAQERGQWTTARERYSAAVDLLRDIGDVPYEAMFLAHLATIAASEDDAAEAARLLAQAEQLGAVAGSGGPDAFRTLYRGHLDLALARASEAAGDAVGAAQRRRVVLERLDTLRRSFTGRPPPQPMRVSIRILERALSGDKVDTATGSSEGLVLGPGARWFHVSGGERVELARRANLRRVLERLGQQHRDAPGRGLTNEDLFKAGWPGESAVPRAAANRVRVALATLRKLGLREYLITTSDGYALDPDTRVEVIDV